MLKRVVWLVWTLLLVTILASPLAKGAVAASTYGAAPISLQSSITQIPDFYAQGTSDAYSLKMTSRGGYLSSGDWKLFLTPWGYVSTNWTTGTIYIIFLANVTATDFRIMFLYVSNTTTPIILRMYDYQTGNLNMMTFDGVQWIHAGLVSTVPHSMPKLALSPEAKIDNKLSAIGPEVYITGNSGKILNGTETLSVYPLVNQLYQGPTDYNELWTLLVDASYNYYFAILYMQNSDYNHVTMTHVLRLNDYATTDGGTFTANWINDPFRSRLTVTMPIPNVTVKVDGFPFQSIKRGAIYAEAYVPSGNVTVEIPGTIQAGSDTRLIFSSWDSYGNENPLSTRISGHLELDAEYKTQYRLSIVTPTGDGKGSGWYDSGTNVTFSVPSVQNFENGTQRSFRFWSGDYTGTLATASVRMDSPKRIQAVYETEYQVSLQLVGTPANASVSLLVNGQAQTVTGSEPTKFWAPENGELSIEVQTTRIQEADRNYNFTELQVSGSQTSSRIVVTQPTTVSIVFSGIPKQHSSIQLQASPNAIVVGYPITIKGSLTGINAPTAVTLSYSKNKVTWNTIADVTTSSNGDFTYTWLPEVTGTYFLRATWPGDEMHESTYQEVPVKIQDLQLPNVQGTDPISKILQDSSDRLRSVPVVSSLLRLAESLFVLGVMLAGLIGLAGSPVIGYFIGSIMVGFVFVFPISAFLLSVRALMSRRSPSVAWLMPLAIIWLTALALVASKSALALPPGFIEASMILLISSNTVFMPLALSLLLARAISR